MRSLRSFHGPLVAALVASAVILSGGSALGAHQIAHTGSPGAWGLPDTAANPAARCSYAGGGVAGGTYLTGIRLLNEVELWGTGPALRSVGFRPLIQHKLDGTWKTVKKGILVTGVADESAAVSLAGGLTTFGVVTQPRAPFRLALKLIWYTGTAAVQGTRTIVVDSYVRRDGGVGIKCKGFISDVAS